MATGKRPPGDQNARRRRPAPTIDLKATEIPPDPAAAPAAEQPRTPYTTQAPEPIVPPAPEPPMQSASESPPPEPPRESPSGNPLPGEPPASEPPPAELERGTAARADFPWRMVSAGAAGGVAALLVLILAWLVLPARDPAAPLAARLASIESQLRDLAGRPAPIGVDPKAIEDLSARLAKLETAVAAPRPPANDPALAGRISATENAVKSVSDNVAALGRRTDEIATTLRELRSRSDATGASINELQNTARTSSADHSQIETLSNRIAILEQDNRAVTEELAKRSAAAATDRNMRLAVAASALRTAVERGDPFAAELAAVKSLGVDANAVAPLEPFAGSGVPSNAALSRELAVLIQPMLRASGANAREGGILDRLQANAERLVRIRPLEEAPGDDPAAVLARIEVKAAHNDVPGAFEELKKLPPGARAPAQAWIGKAEARPKAVEASRRIAADAMAGLKAAP